MDILQNFYKLSKIAILLIALLFCLSLCLVQTAAKAQASTETSSLKADVVLDGRKILEIGSSGNFSATQRAEKINSLLQTKVQEYSKANSQLSLDTTVVRQSDWTVIRVNDRHLLTVTENDVIPGMSAREQAEIWQERISSAILRGIEERSPDHLKRTKKKLAIASFLVIGFQFGLFFLKRRFNRNQLKSSSPGWFSWGILGVLILQALIGLIFIYYCTSLFPQTRTWQYYLWHSVSNTFDTKMFDFGGETTVSLRQIILLVFLGIGWWLFVRWFSRLLRLNLLPLTRLESTLQGTIAFLTYYGLLFLGLLLILDGGGIDFRSLTIILSALGVGIGFGLQNIAKDFVSGLILTLTRPIKIGELVEVGEDKGLVLRIGARTTEISHVDRHIITVPNSRFIEETFRNWHRSGLTRVKVYINVAYDSDRDLVYKALLVAAQVYHPDVLKHPPPKVKFRSFENDSLLFRVVVFIKDPFKEPKVRNHLQQQIDINLRKYGIEIPLPQRDIHLKIPQLDELVANLAKVYAASSPQLYYPNTKSNSSDRQIPLSTEELTIHDEYNWDSLVAAMRGENGVTIADRRYGLKTYQNVFLGSEAVSWLRDREKATLAEAITIGQLMIEQNLIHHVLDEHDFKNEPLFYRFYIDEEDNESRATSN